MPRIFTDRYLKSGPEPIEAEWAQVQIVLNAGDKTRKEGRPAGGVKEAEFHDPLFHRAAGAMQIGLKSAIGKEGR